VNVSVKKIGEVCVVKRGTTITQKHAVEGEVPVVAGGIKPTYFHNIANRTGKTITISGSGANAGFVNFWGVPIFASDCTTIQVENENISINYVHYFLLSKQDYIYKELRSGAAQPHVYGRDIAEIKIPLPPLAIEEKIVAKLDAIFAEINKAVSATEANIKNAEALFQSYLSDIFNAENEEWFSTEIGKICKLEYGKALPENYRDLAANNAVYGANGEKTRTNKFLFDGKSIVLGRKGSAGELTRVDGKFWTLDVAYYVTCDKTKFSIDFIYYLLLSKDLKRFVKGVKPGINRNDVYSLACHVPKLETQINVAQKLDSIAAEIKKLKNTKNSLIKNYEALKQSILQQEFNGELVRE
jgi:restriction endonuclease S subunit